MTDIKTCVPPLRLSSDIQSQIYETFLWLEYSIQALLPDATIEHVGSSAIPGALTKGDVDVNRSSLVCRNQRLQICWGNCAQGMRCNADICVRPHLLQT